MAGTLYLIMAPSTGVVNPTIRYNTKTKERQNKKAFHGTLFHFVFHKEKIKTIPKPMFSKKESHLIYAQIKKSKKWNFQVQ